jgi:myo-inositol-1(or 4)-monophosphatase
VSGDHLDALLELATAAAREAGKLLLTRSAEWRRTARAKATPTDMVSDADHASEALIVERIRSARPHDAFLGEEGGPAEGSSGVRWLIDPLDGTTNYLYGIPSWCVSIAGELRGETGVAAVYDAVHDELFAAAVGQRATRNGAPIAVSGNTDLATALVGTGFDYAAERRAEQGRTVARVLPRVRDIRRPGAASLDLCWVACGRLDAYYERGLGGWWDMAAGALIAQQAGGVTGAIEGGSAHPGSVLAATPAIFEPLRLLLVEAERR